MQLEVLLFGPYAAAAGRASCVVDVSEEPTAANVLDELKRSAAPLAPLMTGARLAVNHAFAPADAVIKRGDEVALIGMVSGG